MKKVLKVAINLLQKRMKAIKLKNTAYIYIYIYIYIYLKIGKKNTLLSLQACFVIAHLSGDFNFNLKSPEK